MKTRTILLILFMIIFLIPSVSAGNPLVVASTAPLAEIIKEAFGNSVNVEYLIPPSVDPHQYQLTPDQVEFIKKADVIVTSNGHLPVERKIKELREEDTIHAEVLLAEDYAKYGFRFLPERWYDNKRNPHGIWLDPYNALAISEATKNALIARYPANREIYENSYNEFKAKVLGIVEAYKALVPKNVTVVVEFPSQQYALEWLGVKVVASIKPEEEIPAKSVDEMLEIAKSVDFIAYSSKTPETLKNAAVELSKKTGKPLAEITTIWTDKPYTEILIENSKAIIDALNQKTIVIQQNTNVEVENINVTYIILALIIGVSLGITVGVLLMK